MPTPKPDLFLTPPKAARKRTANPPKYEWRVQYRRRWWNNRQGRIYQSAAPARRLVAKLRRGHFDLEPIVELGVQRRVVGEWEDVQPRSLIDVDQHRGRRAP